MSQSPDILPCIALGADAGGSKVRLRWTDGMQTVEREMPSINLRRVSPAEAADVLAQAVLHALAGRPLAPDAVCCFGAAGAGTESVVDALRAGLTHRLGLPGSRILVTSDARIAHRAAFGTRPGILIIAGTGSGCYAVGPDERLIRAGGWGPGLGDPGSGTALGQAATKALLTALESGHLTPFSRDVADSMGVSEPTVSRVLDAFYDPGFHAARLAPTVLDAVESGDDDARCLVEEQVEALARQTARLTASLKERPDGIALVGGLMERESYVVQLRSALGALLPDLPVARSTQAPEEGALEWAVAERKRLSS